MVLARCSRQPISSQIFANTAEDDVKRALAFALLCVGTIGLTPPSRSAVDLKGVWWTVEARDAAGNDITDHGQRTMFIFTCRHFAITWTEIERPQFSPPLSDSQKAAMWQGFGAQAGTYEIAADRANRNRPRRLPTDEPPST